MPAKKAKVSRSTSARALERPRKELREALEAFRSKAGDAATVASTLWSFLETEEKAALQTQCLPDLQSKDDSASTKVVQTVAGYAGGSSNEAAVARGLLAKAGHHIFKKKSQAERALNLNFSRRVWTKVCINKLGAKKRGRKNKTNDPDITRQVREFLLKNSLISSHYRRIGKELVQCRALSRSKTKLWKLNPGMQKLMSLTIWLRHLRAQHPQFVKYKKKVDMCPICHKYDKLVIPRVRKAVESALQHVLSVEAGYFAKMDAHWSGLEAAGKIDPDGKSSLQFVRGAINFINQTMQARASVPLANVAGERKGLMDLREGELAALGDLKSVLGLLEACEHHFHTVRRQHACREKMEEALPEDTVLLQLDYAENITLPLGPIEEQSWFWATARLSFSTLGFYALKDCIQRLGLPASCSKIQIWSDCGPHFRAYAFAATAVDILRDSASFQEIYFSFFGEHHGKGRNDGQFGLQRRWLEDFAQRNVISTCEQLLKALKVGASHSMLSGPPPTGPEYQIVHFHPEKPRTFLYLDVSAKDLKIEYTYCLAFFKTASKNFPARMTDFVYTDRIDLVDGGKSLGHATVVDKVCDAEDWRVSYRKDQPEKEALPEALLQRRLQAQKYAKTSLTQRRSTEMERVLSDERRRAHKSQKAQRERIQFKASTSSSSATSSSDSDASEND
eukprot:s140_g60.t1